MDERWKNENVTDRHGAAIAGNGGRMYFVLGKGNHVHDLFHSFCRLHLFISLSPSLSSIPITYVARNFSAAPPPDEERRQTNFGAITHFLRNALEVRGACPLCPVKNSARAAALHLSPQQHDARETSDESSSTNLTPEGRDVDAPLCPGGRAVLGTIRWTGDTTGHTAEQSHHGIPTQTCDVRHTPEPDLTRSTNAPWVPDRRRRGTPFRGSTRP